MFWEQGPGWLQHCPLPSPQGPPRRFDGGANIWGRAGVSGLSPTLFLQEARAEPIVGPRPPGPPGRSDMAAHRQWAVAQYFKGCPAQSAAPPARPLGLYLWGGDPFSLPQRLLSRLAGVQVEPRLPSPSPLSPPPSPHIPVLGLLWRMCWDPGVVFGFRE